MFFYLFFACYLEQRLYFCVVKHENNRKLVDFLRITRLILGG